MTTATTRRPLRPDYRILADPSAYDDALALGVLVSPVGAPVLTLDESEGRAAAGMGPASANDLTPVAVVQCWRHAGDAAYQDAHPTPDLTGWANAIVTTNSYLALRRLRAIIGSWDQPRKVFVVFRPGTSLDRATVAAMLPASCELIDASALRSAAVLRAMDSGDLAQFRPRADVRDMLAAAGHAGAAVEVDQ